MDELTRRLGSIEGQVVDLGSKLDEMRDYIEDEIRWGIVHSVRGLITVAFATTYLIVGIWWLVFVIFSKSPTTQNLLTTLLSSWPITAAAYLLHQIDEREGRGKHLS